MLEADFLLRSVAFTLLALSLYLARVLSGRGIGNIPLWNGLGMLALYACYCFSGIRFNNGSSGGAELIVAAFVATSVGSFVLGERISAKRSPAVRHTQHALLGGIRDFIRPIPALYLWAVVVVSSVFYLILTHGQPWRLLTDGVGLKFERLHGITEKSPLLLNIDALVFSTTLIGLAWSILGYRDNRRSRIALGVSVFLILLYVLSTGSRSPLIGVLLQVLPAMGVARLHSRDMAWLSRKKWFFVLALAAGIIFMVVTTGSRIEFEALSDDVFRFYFDIDDFGVITQLFQSGDAASFFLATAVTYAASTFNNVVIRYQEMDSVTLSMGYKFFFYYISAVQILIPGLVPRAASDWRDLATTNNNHLASISQAAGQWATPYGDLIWDFGIIGTFVIVALFGVVAGLIIGSARKNPSFKIILLKVVVVGFSLSPLVNPFLSLYVHYALVLVIFIALWSSQRPFGTFTCRRHHESQRRSQRYHQTT